MIDENDPFGLNSVMADLQASQGIQPSQVQLGPKKSILPDGALVYIPTGDPEVDKQLAQAIAQEQRNG